VDLNPVSDRYGSLEICDLFQTDYSDEIRNFMNFFKNFYLSIVTENQSVSFVISP